MIFATILAGGSGSRMGNTEKPKQFLLLGEKPVLIHTIEKFSINNKIDKIIVLTPKEWINHTEDLIKKYLSHESIIVIEGGKTRTDTIENAINYIYDNFSDEEHVIVTHDAVRPFLTHRIIDENIEMAKKYGACDTVIPATDTIVKSNDGKNLTEIPLRNELYQGQTPQSFNLKKLKKLLDKLTKEDKKILTDACKIFIINDEPVSIIMGEPSNMKITYPYDLKVANFILEEY